MEIDVRGADQFAALGRDLKRAGDSGLRRELFKAAMRATRPLKEAFKAAWSEGLPQTGGLNDWVTSRLKLATKIRTGGRWAGVRIKQSRPKKGGQADLAAMDRGRLRRPVYGRAPWQTQQIEGGIVDKVMSGLAPRIARRELLQAVDAIRAQIRGAA